MTERSEEDTLPQLLKILAKMYLDRRPFRGRSEFSFNIGRLKGGGIEILVRARDCSFQTVVVLRRNSADLSTFDQVFVNNDYNLRRLSRWKEIIMIYKALKNEGTPLILDLGANIGLASLYFAKNWPEALITSVEPEERNYSQMTKNTCNVNNILPIQAAVASRDGAIAITNPDGRACEYRTKLAKPGEIGVIKALSVDSILDCATKNKSPRPFIVKIDIEGFEDELFSENTDWINRFPILILELHDWLFTKQGKSRNFLQTISRHNRDFVYMSGNIVSITNEYE